MQTASYPADSYESKILFICTGSSAAIGSSAAHTAMTRNTVFMCTAIYVAYTVMTANCFYLYCQLCRLYSYNMQNVKCK